MQEPSLILAIAVILEMFLPLGRRFKLDGLMGVFSALGRKGTVLAFPLVSVPLLDSFSLL